MSPWTGTHSTLAGSGATVQSWNRGQTLKTVAWASAQPCSPSAWRPAGVQGPQVGAPPFNFCLGPGAPQGKAGAAAFFAPSFHPFPASLYHTVLVHLHLQKRHATEKLHADGIFGRSNPIFHRFPLFKV